MLICKSISHHFKRFSLHVKGNFKIMIKNGNLFLLFPISPLLPPHMHTSKEIRGTNFIATVLQNSVETNLNNDLFLKINKTESNLLSLEKFGIIYWYETTESIWYLKAITNPAQPAFLMSIVQINWLTLRSEHGMRAQGLPFGMGDCCTPLPELKSNRAQSLSCHSIPSLAQAVYKLSGSLLIQHHFHCL